LFHDSGDFIFMWRSRHRTLFFAANSFEFRERCFQ
jgi:hypothetical protein